MNRYEDGLQFATAELLDLRGYRWTHFPAGEKRHPKTGAKLKRMGLKKGVPDCLIFEPWEWSEFGYSGSGFGMAIELKAPGKYPTKDQREWMAALNERGWRCVVCRTTQEVVDAVAAIV